MHKTIIVVFLILRINNYISQTNYIEYTKRITEAEIDILDSNYSSSIAKYKLVFKDYDFVFASDCFRACQTAITINDYIDASYFIERGFKQGITLEIIQRDSILINLTRSDNWHISLAKYDSLRKIYIGNVNWELRSKINQLNTLDQKHRDKHETHPLNILWRPLIWVRWKNITKKIVEKELSELIKKYGFPGERLTGLDEKWMLQKQKNDHLTSSYAFIILIHYYSIPRPDDLNSLLIKDIYNGHITSSHYASLIDFQAKWGKEKHYKGLHYNEWHSSKDTTQYNQINLKRAEIGLGSLEMKRRIHERGLKACKERKKNNFKHIRFWSYCG